MGNFISRLGRRFTAQTIGADFRAAFFHDAGERVLQHLGEFCRADLPAPQSPDMFAQGRAAGRRDVWLFLQTQLRLDPEQLHALWAGRSVTLRGDQDG